MRPTRRAVVDIGRKCNLNCMFCYHKHLGDLRKQGFKDFNAMVTEINNAKLRGNEWIDFTGGEPTICPDIYALIDQVHSEGMKACIITNGIAAKPDELIRYKLDDLLVSIQGPEEVHDKLAQHPNARRAQIEFLQAINGYIPFRFNTVINALTQNRLYDTIVEMAGLIPYIWNFINFNPHYDWAASSEETQGIIADLDIVQRQMEQVIPTLERLKRGVNLRYYPMCKISEEYRRVVCNDYHVSFDPYEWDYSIHPKTVEAHLRWALSGSQNTELKDFPCSHCKLYHICGGVNKYFYEAYKTNGHLLEPVKEYIGDYYDFYKYREQNILAFQGMGGC